MKLEGSLRYKWGKQKPRHIEYHHPFDVLKKSHDNCILHRCLHLYIGKRSAKHAYPTFNSRVCLENNGTGSEGG